MPPKAKFTKEEITAAALDIVKNSGADALTARSLGNKLGSSARPVFTVFSGMEEVQAEVVSAAKAVYKSYLDCGMEEYPAFKGVGKAYIKFAAEQPNLFRLLFMREQNNLPDLSNILGRLDDSKGIILSSIQTEYGLNEDAASALYLHLWIYAHGIAVLIVTKVCSFTPEQISEMLTQVFSGLIKKIKTEGRL